MAFQKDVVVRCLIVASLAVAGSALWAQAGSDLPIYLDSKHSVNERVDDLMGRMTLKEKIGQLNLPCVYVDELGPPSAREPGDLRPGPTRRRLGREAAFSRSQTKFCTMEMPVWRPSISMIYKELPSHKRA
jgi:hypothetical protein